MLNNIIYDANSTMHNTNIHDQFVAIGLRNFAV